jgi:hypothetical protein
MGRWVKGHAPWNRGRTGIYSPEVRARISAGAMGRAPWNKGRTGVYSAETRAKMSADLTPEVRAKMAAGRRGVPLSPETRAKLSAALKGYYAANPRSAETRAKLSAALPGSGSRSCWASGSRSRRRLLRQAGYDPVRVSRIKSLECGWFYEIPYRDLRWGVRGVESVRAARAGNTSEAMRERLARMRAARLAKRKEAT